MWSKIEILQYIKENLKESRYIHTLGVAQCAIQLAKINDVNQDRAEVAALIHDCAKNMSTEQMYKLLEESNYEVDDVMKCSPQLLHGKVGAIIANTLMEIEDEEILSSVEFHTTGRKNMTTLEKIIYIADYIEPNRNYPGIEVLRKTTFDNLNEGVLQGLSNTITYVVKNGLMIHPLSVEARNYLIKEKNN